MWTDRDIECSLTYEELNRDDHPDRYPDFCVDANNPFVFRFGGKGVVNLVHPEGKERCTVCHRETRWFEISFLVALCSPRCNEILWGEFWDANERAGPINVV